MVNVAAVLITRIAFALSFAYEILYLYFVEKNIQLRNCESTSEWFEAP